MQEQQNQPEVPEEEKKTEEQEPLQQSMTQSQVIASNLNDQQKKMIMEVDVNMELRKKLWEGQIPLKITLDLNDINHMSRPKSLYIMAPRLNYLFYILDEVKQTFDEYGPADKLEAYNEMWFEGPNRKPLRWSLPLGAQFDAIAGLEGKNKDLPWELVFHYKNFPDQYKEEKETLTMQNYFKFHFFNSLKESQVVRAGSAQDILSAQSSKETQRMMDGLITHNFDAFWEINQVLCNKPFDDIKKYALRIVCNNCSTYIQPHLLVHSLQQTAEEHKQVEDKLIGDVLVDVFPSLFSHEIEDTMETTVQPTMQNMQVLCQGVEVNMKTPLHWMQLNLAYLDNFIYLSFHFS